MTMMKPRIGVVGVGIRGREFAREIVVADTGEVVCYADPHPPSVEKTRAALPHAKPYADWRRMLDENKLDVLIVSSPQHTHAEMSLEALARGLDVYCEKPLAPNLNDCDRILAAVERTSGGIFYVGLQMRSMPVYRKVYDLVRDGVVGRPCLVTYRELRGPFLPKVDNWIANEAKSGGALVEKNCHHFDLFNWLVGSQAERVCAIGGKAAPPVDGNPGDLLDHAVVLVEYATCVRACLEICFLAPMTVHDLEVVGDRGAITADRHEVRLYRRGSVPWTARPRDPDETWSFDPKDAHGDRVVWQDFLECRGRERGRNVESVARARAARESVRIALAAQEAIRSVAVVQLASPHPCS